MASLNKVMLIGNLGKDPEKRFLGSGQAVTSFSIATSARWTSKTGEKQERTEWHRIVVFGPQAENCEKYLSKGRPVFVEGEIRYRTYEDKNGQQRNITEIVAQRVQFLGSPAGAGANTGERTEHATTQTPSAEADPFPPVESQGGDDIPF